MALTEDGKAITDSISEDGRIILDSVLVEDGRIVLEAGTFTGTISATSNVSGAIKTSKKLSGTISATTSISGALSVIVDYVDFTTFTEVDIGADRIQKTANHIDHYACLDETTYLYKDYGTAYFSDFTHEIKVKHVTSTSPVSEGIVWMLSNDLGNAKALEDANKSFIYVSFYRSVNDIRIRLREVYNGTNYTDEYTTDSGTNWRYIKIEKSGTALNVYIYSDSSYSTLLDTLTLTLHVDGSYKYLFGCNTYDSGLSGRCMTMDIENLNIDEMCISGSISAISNVIGAICVSRKIAGGVSGASTVIGALSRARPLTGTITAVASVSGSLIKYIALAGSISALSAPRIHIMRRRVYPSCQQVRRFYVIPGVLSVHWSLKGVAATSSSISGVLGGHWSLKGSVNATSSLSATSSVQWSLKGTVPATSSVSGTLISAKYLTGAITATTSISASLNRDLKLTGAISGISSLAAGLSVFLFAEQRGFYYAKIGSTIFRNLNSDSFRITEELNKIPSFEFEIANTTENRAAIVAGLTDILRIYNRVGSTDTLMFTGIINADAIEYLSLERIRLVGYASYIDLNWRFHKRLNSEDAEDVGTVFDYSGLYTDYTTAANNDTINDVLPTFGGVNDALYIGQSEQFFGAQIKYSTKGVQAASTAVEFEYSKGSSVWATLDVLDETRAFTEDAGISYITIPHKPSDWAKETVNSVKKFWIRARITAGAYTTAPKLDRIKITNVNVYMVYYFDTAANSIMDDLLAGTGYSMDVTDTCPSMEISIVAEYETKLRFIAGITNALTWDDNGDKKAYQWWIDASKKVHVKQKRGNTLGDMSSKLIVLNNVQDYFNLSNRLHYLGNYDGLNQLKAVIEDTASQDTHEIRELAVVEEQYNNYTPLKEAAQKAMTYTKAPLQKIAATMPTRNWLNEAIEVGDTVTLHQDKWNVPEQPFQIVRADIGPRDVNFDLGVSQEHLDSLKAGLQRQMDISGIRMHGSTLILQFGPNEMNYQRVDDTTVYPSRLKFEIPSDARYIHKVVISWKMGAFRADVNGGEESEGHDHTGFGGAGGAHEHGGFAGAGGAHDSSVLDGGLHTPTELGQAHKHAGTAGGIDYMYTTKDGYLATDPFLQYEAAHVHSNPTTSLQSQGHTHSLPTYTGAYDDDNESVANDYSEGSSCTSGCCITGLYGVNVPSTTHWHNLGGSTGGMSHGHTHTQGNTGVDTHPSGHTHRLETGGVVVTRPYMIGPLTIDLTLWETAEESPAHAHTINQVPNHPHTAVAIAAHANHVIGTQIAHGNHSIVTQAAAMIDIALGIVEIAGGTTMMLIVNGETVASNYDGDQTDVVITGYTNTGSNTVEIQPIVGANTKGSTSTEGRGILFIETSSF